MKRLGGDSGQVSILTILCLTCLLGFVAFAVDVGLLLRAKRVEQSAADSAVMAAAAEFNFGDMTVAAQADGVQNGVPASAVAVNNPPLYGPNAGNSSYVEVIVSQSKPTFFMKMFNRNAMTVAARAVATTVPSPSCVDTLLQNPTTPTGKKGAPVSVPGVSMAGSAFLTLPTCGLIDNASSTTDALDVTGGAGISAKSIGVVGGDTLHIGASVTPTPVTGITAISDPLSSLVSPPPASDYASGCISSSITKSTTIGPSSPSGYVCYSSLSAISGSPTITLNPGLYIFNGTGGLDIESGTTFSGSGVTFYFVNGASFTFDRGAVVNLSAPTSGAYSGILFYQDVVDTAMDLFGGDSTGSINGIFYLPSANLTLKNGAATTFNTDLVVGSLTMSGDATLRPYAPLSGASPLSSARLAE
jgi:hypothetical protein